MTLPKHIEIELDKLGLPRPRPVVVPVSRRGDPVWKPTPDDPEPPF